MFFSLSSEFEMRLSLDGRYVHSSKWPFRVVLFYGMTVYLCLFNQARREMQEYESFLEVGQSLIVLQT